MVRRFDAGPRHGCERSVRRACERVALGTGNAGSGAVHTHVQVVDFGASVDVFDLQTDHDALLHADRHGVMVIPARALADLPARIHPTQSKDAPLLAAARQPGFGVDALEQAMREAYDIH